MRHYTLKKPVDENGDELFYLKDVGEIFGRSGPYIKTLVDAGKLKPRKETGHRGGILFDAQEVWKCLMSELPGLAALLAKKQGGSSEDNPLVKKKVEEAPVEKPEHTFTFPELLNPKSTEAFKNVEEQILPDIPINIVDVERTIESNGEKKRMVPNGESFGIQVKNGNGDKVQKPYATTWQSEVAELMCFGYEVASCTTDDNGRPKFLFTETDARFWRVVDEWQTGTSPHRLFDNKLKEVRTMTYQARH